MPGQYLAIHVLEGGEDRFPQKMQVIVTAGVNPRTG
jgi:hypothetical protein